MKNITLLLLAISYTLICIAQPGNDDPCGAIALTVQTGSTCQPTNAFSWTGATRSTGMSDPTCGSYSNYPDIWFKFVSPASGLVSINTKAGTGVGAITDGVMNIYGSGGGCTGPFFHVQCNDDSIPGVLMPFLSLALAPGATYYIRFFDFNGTASGNIGGICVTDNHPPLSTAAVGIGIQNPDNLLDVNGPIKIRGGNPGINKILTSDANGLASWTTPVAAFDPVPFKGTNSADQIVPSGSGLILGFNVEEYDYGSNFNLGTFNTPADGVYHFDAAIYWQLSGISSPTSVSLLVYVSGTLLHAMETRIAAGTTAQAQSMSVDLFLTTGQTVQIKANQISGINQTVVCNVPGIGKFSFFDGHRVK